jgi:hypothetical protein
MAQVLIKKGVHGGKVLSGVTFELVRGLSMGNRGPFLMVNGTGIPAFPQRNFKVLVENAEDFTITGDDADQFVPSAGRPRDELAKRVGAGTSLFTNEPVTDTNETDEEIRNRLAERFDIMERMVMAAARGTIKGLIVSGAPGTGKSFGVEHALGRDSLIDKLAFDAENDEQDRRRMERDGTFKPRYKIVKGYATAPALYRILYEYSGSKEVLAFDDCDSILYDDVALNLLKAALDTSGKRELSWLSGHRVGGRDGDVVPDRFEFQGSVIFITNVDFERSSARNSKIAPHLEAMMDRCLYLDLTIHSLRDKMVRIEHVCKDLRMLETKGLDAVQVDEVMQFVRANARRFKSLSLRKVDQLADIRLASKNWSREAEIMLLKGVR